MRDNDEIIESLSFLIVTLALLASAHPEKTVNKMGKAAMAHMLNLIPALGSTEDERELFMELIEKAIGQANELLDGMGTGFNIAALRTEPKATKEQKEKAGQMVTDLLDKMKGGA